MTGMRMVKRIAEFDGVAPSLHQLAKRAEETTIVVEPHKDPSPHLSPQVVISVVGGLVVLWLLCLTLSVLCKYLNKPRSAAHVGGYLSSQAHLYQPSAAGYGVRASSPSASMATGDKNSPSNHFGASASLLATAGPMGATTPDDSVADLSGTSFEYSTPMLDSPQRPSPNQPPQPFASPAGRAPGQHHRHASSGVGLPGPASAVVRRGVSAQHPPTMTGGSGPDGSGFRPGQIVGNPNAVAGPSFSSLAGRAQANGPTKSGQGVVGVERSNSRAMRGPPPARANSNRRSRYSRTPRIESVSQGMVRESYFYDEDGNIVGPVEDGRGPGGDAGTSFEYMQPMGSNNDGSVNYSRRSRVASAGARRSMHASGNGMPSRASVYGSGTAIGEAMRRAQAEGFGSGTPVVGATRPPPPDRNGSDPLGAQVLPMGKGNYPPYSQQQQQYRPQIQQQQQPGYPQQRQPLSQHQQPPQPRNGPAPYGNGNYRPQQQQQQQQQARPQQPPMGSGAAPGPRFPSSRPMVGVTPFGSGHVGLGPNGGNQNRGPAQAPGRRPQLATGGSAGTRQLL